MECDRFEFPSSLSITLQSCTAINHYPSQVPQLILLALSIHEILTVYCRRRGRQGMYVRVDGRRALLLERLVVVRRAPSFLSAGFPPVQNTFEAANFHQPVRTEDSKLICEHTYSVIPNTPLFYPNCDQISPSHNSKTARSISYDHGLQ